jgi:hypothetical protein
MGSLRKHFYNIHFYNIGHRLSFLRALLALVISPLFLVSLVSCVPTVSTSHLEFFFSEEAWGGSPFNETEKKDLFVAALKARDSERISEEIPFEISDTSVTVKRFTALYEVDANIGLPKVRSGYVLELSLGTTPPERVTLTNMLTGVSWAIRLAPPAPLATGNK